jgi:hypothetical protein
MFCHFNSSRAIVVLNVGCHGKNESALISGLRSCNLHAGLLADGMGAITHELSL